MDDQPSLKKPKLDSEDNEVSKINRRNELDRLKFNSNGVNAKSTVKLSRSKSTTKTNASNQASTGYKMTKFESFVNDVKNSNPDTFLLYERAFRYFMYGEDARYVGAEFGKTVVQSKKDDQDGTFAYTSVRQENLAPFVRQLVDRGLKVGLVEQTESGIVKQASVNSSTRLLDRKLTRIYTKGTFIDDLSNETYTGKSHDLTSGYLLGITENPQENDVYSFSIVAAIVATGETLTDKFQDDSMFQELDNKLALLRPCEIVLVGSINESAYRLIRKYAINGKYPIRSEKRTKESVDTAQEYFIEKFQDDSDLLDYYLSLDQSILICLYGLSSYVAEYGVSLGKLLFENSLKTTVALTKSTLENLGIVDLDTDIEGSLSWLMDQTHTSFGQRLFKKWIAKPLTMRDKIEERLDAVTEMKSKSHLIRPLLDILDKLSDLEAYLTAIELSKIKSHHLYYFLQHIKRISGINDPKFQSSILRRIFSELPLAKGIVTKNMTYINSGHLQDMDTYFNEKYEGYENIEDEKIMAGEIQFRIEEYLEELKSTTGIGTLKYTTGKTKVVLIQVDRHLDSKIPDSWVKAEATKAKFLYTTIELDKLRQELALANEKVIQAGRNAFNDFVKQLSKHCGIFRLVITAVAELDCLISLTSISHGFVRPSFVDQQILDLKNSWNPIISSRIGYEKCVKSDISMHPSKDRVCIITGPNMGGKSSFAKQIAITVLMAQVGSYVPATQAVIGIFDGIFTRMGATDRILQGQSTFMVEMIECSEILHKATDRSLILLDEIGRGTSSIDGSAVAYSVLWHLITDTRGLTIFITHYPEITTLAGEFSPQVSNWHVSYVQRTDIRHCIQLLYRVIRGATKASFGLNVAEMAEIPKDVIQRAKLISIDLKERHEVAKKHKQNMELCRLMKGNLETKIDIKDLVKFASKRRLK